MEDTQKKKISNFMWWLALIVIICWLISNSPIILFELAILGGIWLYLSKSSRKSADINEKEEVVEEKEPDFVVAGEKTDSFYSGISVGSSINVNHSDEKKSTSKGSSISESRSGISGGLHP